MLRVKDTDIIRQANSLTMATYSLSKNEKRLIYLSLSAITKGHVKPNDVGTYPVEIRHKDFESLFNDDGSKNICRDIGNASLTLNKKEVVFYLPEEDLEEEKALDAISWTVKRSHRPKNGITTIYINPELVKIINKTTKNYTALLAADIAKLDKPSAMRLYDSLKQFEQAQKVTFRIDSMIERYQLSAKYNDRLPDFRRRFLNPALTEINEKTSINVTATEITAKGANKPHLILFNIKSKFKKYDSEKQIASLERAVKTFVEVKDRLSIPSISDIENLKSYKEKLVNDHFEYDEKFEVLLCEVEARAAELLELT